MSQRNNDKVAKMRALYEVFMDIDRKHGVHEQSE